MSTTTNQVALDIPVDEFTIEFMLVHLVRNQAVFDVGRAQLPPELFINGNEQHYHVIWQSALAYGMQYARLPTHQWLSAAVVSRMAAATTTLHDGVAEAGKLVDWIYDDEVNPENEIHADVGLDILQRFLQDRQVHQPILRAAEMHRAGGTVDLPAVLAESMRQSNHVAAIRAVVPSQVVPVGDAFGGVTRERFPTGVPVIDERLDGGAEAGDTNVLLGPTGVGKTLLAVQMLTSYARSQEVVRAAGGQPRLAVYISYEAPMHEIQVRMLSFGARIDKTRLEQAHAWADLSSTGNLQEYERRMFGQQNLQTQPGEQERIMLAKPWMDAGIKIFDFSGARIDGQPPRGHGGIDEIRVLLDAVASQAGPIGWLGIDWAGTAVRRSIRAQGQSPDRMYHHELTEYVDRVHDKLAAPFECQAWVMHQMSGQSNKRLPATELHHSDAEGCTSFAVNAWAAFCLGTKDRKSSTCLLAATKTRRGEGKDNVILHINGAFGEMRPASNEYMVDTLTRCIVPRRDRGRIRDFGREAAPVSRRKNGHIAQDLPK